MTIAGVLLVLFSSLLPPVAQLAVTLAVLIGLVVYYGHRADSRTG